MSLVEDFTSIVLSKSLQGTSSPIDMNELEYSSFDTKEDLIDQILELEERLKSKIDKGITVWCEPIGDKSKLRKLRGIKINT